MRQLCGQMQNHFFTRDFKLCPVLQGPGPWAWAHEPGPLAEPIWPGPLGPSLWVLLFPSSAQARAWFITSLLSYFLTPLLPVVAAPSVRDALSKLKLCDFSTRPWPLQFWPSGRIPNGPAILSVFTKYPNLLVPERSSKVKIRIRSLLSRAPSPRFQCRTRGCGLLNLCCEVAHHLGP